MHTFSIIHEDGTVEEIGQGTAEVTLKPDEKQIGFSRIGNGASLSFEGTLAEIHYHLSPKLRRSFKSVRMGPMLYK